jgi:hypothetical protein
MRIALPQSRPIGARSPSPVGRLVLASALLMFVSIVAPAGADVGTTIIERCTHGQSLSGFSQQAYSRALQEMPTEVEEYSDCGNLIRRAQEAAAGGGGGSAGGSGPAVVATPLTPSERSALARVPKTGPAPLRVGDQIVRPGVVHADIASALSSLPTPLLAILAFMLACALARAGRALQDRVRARRSS